MKINRILCPTDFSVLATLAVDKASRLAKQHNAVLHIVHIYEPVFTDPSSHGIPPADIEPIKDILDAIQPTVEGVETCHELIYGLPAGSIVGYARTNDIDLIVMGTHGSTALSRFAFGSVAENVVRWAECAVLTVKGTAGKPCETVVGT